MLPSFSLCAPSSSQNVPVNGVELFKQWSCERCQTVSMCPKDLLDTAYPMNVLDYWISMFLREARMDFGGSFSEGVLCAAIRDIQDHVNKHVCSASSHTVWSTRDKPSMESLDFASASSSLPPWVSIRANISTCTADGSFKTKEACIHQLICNATTDGRTRDFNQKAQSE